MRLIVTILFLMNFIEVYCQLGLPPGSRQGAVRPFNEFVLSDWNQKSELPYHDIDGSPFLTDDWAKGELRTLKDEYFQAVLMKVNLYEGQLLHYNHFTKDSSSINLDLIWEFSIPLPDTTLIFSRYQSPEKDADAMHHFFVEMYKDKVSLLARPIVKLQKSSRSSIVNSAGKLKDRFVLQTEYFIAKPDNTVLTLKQKKSRIQAFNDYFDQVQLYAKTSRLQWDNQQDLLAIIGYYCSLLP